MDSRKAYARQAAQELLNSVDYGTDVTFASDTLKQDVDVLSEMMYRFLVKEQMTNSSDVRANKFGLVKVTERGTLALRSKHLRTLASLVNAFVMEQYSIRKIFVSKTQREMIRDYVQEILTSPEAEYTPLERNVFAVGTSNVGTNIGENPESYESAEKDNEAAMSALKETHGQYLDRLEKGIEALDNVITPTAFIKNEKEIVEVLVSLKELQERMAQKPLEKNRTWIEIQNYLSLLRSQLGEIRGREKEGTVFFAIRLHWMVDYVEYFPNPLKSRTVWNRFLKKLRNLLSAYNTEHKNRLDSPYTEIGVEMDSFVEMINFPRPKSLEEFLDKSVKKTLRLAATSLSVIIAEAEKLNKGKADADGRVSGAKKLLSALKDMFYANTRDEMVSAMMRTASALKKFRLMKPEFPKRKNIFKYSQVLEMHIRSLLTEDVVAGKDQKTKADDKGQNPGGKSEDVYMYARAGTPLDKSKWPESAKASSPWRGEFLRLKKSILKSKYNSVERKYATHERQRGVLIFTNNSEKLAYLVPLEDLQANFPDVYATTDPEAVKTYLYHRSNGETHTSALQKSQAEKVSEEEFHKMMEKPSKTYTTVKDNKRLPELISEATRLHAEENKSTEEALKDVPGNVDVVASNHVENKRYHALLKDVLKSMKGYYQNNNKDWNKARVGPYSGNDGLGYVEHPGHVLLRLNISEGSSTAYLAVPMDLFNERLIDVFRTGGEKMGKQQSTYLYLRAAKVNHANALGAATNEKPLVIGNNKEYLDWLRRRLQKAGENKKLKDAYTDLIENLMKSDPSLKETEGGKDAEKAKKPQQAPQQPSQKENPKPVNKVQKKKEAFGIHTDNVNPEQLKGLKTLPSALGRGAQAKPPPKPVKVAVKPTEEPKKKKGFFQRLKEAFKGSEINTTYPSATVNLNIGCGVDVCADGVNVAGRLVSVTTEEIDKFALRLAMLGGYVAIGATKIVQPL